MKEFYPVVVAGIAYLFFFIGVKLGKKVGFHEGWLVGWEEQKQFEKDWQAEMKEIEDNAKPL